MPKVDTARPSKPTATAGNVSVQGKKEVTEIKVDDPGYTLVEAI